MPDSPDFDQIAMQVFGGDAADVALVLRQVWNARGAADIKEFDAATARQLEADASHQTNLDLNAVTRALRSLDR